MIITKKRIRSLKGNTPALAAGQNYIVGISNPSDFDEQLRAMGFQEITVGDSILPPGVFGPTSRYNAEGKEIVHKDKPMETAYRQSEWRWTQWDGSEHSRIVDVPYKRYPRTYVDPMGLEFTVQADTLGNPVVVLPLLTHDPKDEEVEVHAINLTLEIFGQCHFFTEDLDQIIKAPIRKLNWRLLPPGEHPWPKLRQSLSPVIQAVPDGNRVVIEHRLEAINKHKPAFGAIGEGGFHGYVVLGFPDKEIYVLESLLYGNATYVLDARWEEISKLTKKEILQEELHKARVIHKSGWDEKIRKLLS